MSKTFTVEVQLTDGQTVYINDCSTYRYSPSGERTVFVVEKRESIIIFNADYVIYIGEASLFDTPEAPPEDDGWIAVRDERPEPHVPVLGVGMTLGGRGQPIIGECWMVEDVFYFPRQKGCLEVTHWRPLPDLPEEVEQ